MDVFSLAALGVFAIGAAAVALPRYLRTRRAMNEPIGGDSCVACQSTSVTELAPECYRCDSCRFEWGEGLKRRADEKRRQQIQALSVEDRRTFALKELAEADARLQAAEVSLEHARKQLTGDLLIGGGGGGLSMTGGDMYSRARNEGIVQAATEMGMAQKHIRNAADATDGGALEDVADISFSSPMFGLDIMFDNIVTDIAGHAQANKLLERAKSMREGIALAQKALEKPETPGAYR